MSIDSRASRGHLRSAMRLLGIPMVLLAAAPALGQTAPTPHPISLREAVTLSVQQNRVIRSADADVEIAQGNELSANGLLDFEVDGNASWSRVRSSPIAGAVNSQTASDNVHTEATA